MFSANIESVFELICWWHKNFHQSSTLSDFFPLCWSFPPVCPWCVHKQDNLFLFLLFWPMRWSSNPFQSSSAIVIRDTTQGWSRNRKGRNFFGNRFKKGFRDCRCLLVVISSWLTNWTLLFIVAEIDCKSVCWQFTKTNSKRAWEVQTGFIAFSNKWKINLFNKFDWRINF